MEKADTFRLGQSFWPDEELEPRPPEDLCGHWSVDRMPAERWRALQPPNALEQTFTAASFRTRPDGTGDYILIDGYNGQGRNPYHCFALLELRLDGRTVLRGYNNQVVVKLDGMVHPRVARYAGLEHCSVLGRVARAVAVVPDAPFCSWRRAVLQRVGEYALIIDSLTFREQSANVELQTLWETRRSTWNSRTGQLRVAFGDESEPDVCYVISPSDAVRARVQGGSRSVSVLSRFVEVYAGQRITSFSLIASAPPGEARGRVRCARLDERSAALLVPSPGSAAGLEPALAAVGDHGLCNAQYAVLSGAHVYGLGVTRLGPAESPWLQSDVPVDVDWDLRGGELTMHAEADARVELALTVDGRERRNAIDVQAAHEPVVCSECRPDEEHMRSLQSTLARAAATLGTTRDVARARTAEPDLPRLAEGMSTSLEDRIADLAVIPAAEGTCVAVAVGKTIRVLSPEGGALAEHRTDAEIRVIHWWAEEELLLAGCKDEKVVAIAVDLTADKGQILQPRWEFVSEMAPWVYTHQASHWWKEAGPHHAGIHGLTSGAFLEGDATQVIVGSACTVEVLAANGELLLRREQVWGDIVHMLIVSRPDGARDLLSVRRPSLTSRVNILNNRALDPKRTGYLDVPAGHTDIKSWGRSRYHLFCTDQDGDGLEEVIGDINGPWDRVTIWGLDGHARHSAPFGPGSRRTRSLRDLTVADLDGDGRQEILVGTDAGLLIALNSRCEKVWSKRLAVPVSVFEVIRGRGAEEPWIVVACADGTVLALDGTGTGLRQGSVEGRPTHIVPVERGGDVYALFVTVKGDVRTFRIG